MSNYAHVNLNSTKDQERWLPCSECDGKTNHKVLVSANTSEEVYPNAGIYHYEDYEVVQCQGCRTISFREAWGDSDDVYQNEFGEYESNEHIELYPGRVAGRHKLRDSRYLPSQIISIYNETHSALWVFLGNAPKG